MKALTLNKKGNAKNRWHFALGVALLGISAVSLLKISIAQSEPSFKIRSAGFMHAKSPQGQELIIPLKKTSADLEIMGSIMEVQVLQEFHNENKFPLEAVYVFPLPDNATVTNYRILYENKVIRSVVQRKNEAKATYEKAKASGQRTALLEQERPNIFTTSVANILPGEKVEIEVTYLAPLRYQDGSYEVLFPTVVGPRYIPIAHSEQEAVQDAHRITPPLVPEGMDPNYEFAFKAKISGIPFEAISSPTHDIKVSEEDFGEARVNLKKKAIPNGDFVLKIEVAQSEQPAIALTQHREDSYQYGLLNIFPPLMKPTEAQLPREILFLVDTSGSMDGTSIEQAREGLKQCLGGLGSQDFFNITRFSSDFSSFHTQSLPATSENIGKALYYVEGLMADGGTEMQPALEHVLTRPQQPDTLRMVVFLTDGDVGNESSLLQLLNHQLNGARLFAFGIGSAPNEYLLRRMGEHGHGVTQFIHNQNEISEVIANFFKTIESPVLTHVEVEWVDQQGRALPQVVSFPKVLPDVYEQRPLSLSFRFPEKNSTKQQVIRVKGKLGQKPVSYSFSISQQDSIHSGIKTLFGRAEVDALLYDYQFKSNTDYLRQEIKEEVTQAALYYQLVTPFTSRVAVEEKIVRREGDQLVTTKVPTLLPKGWNRPALVGTATQDTLCLLIGAVLISLSLVLWKVQAK